VRRRRQLARARRFASPLTITSVLPPVPASIPSQPRGGDAGTRAARGNAGASARRSKFPCNQGEGWRRAGAVTQTPPPTLATRGTDRVSGVCLAGRGGGGPGERRRLGAPELRLPTRASLWVLGPPDTHNAPGPQGGHWGVCPRHRLRSEDAYLESGAGLLQRPQREAGGGPGRPPSARADGVAEARAPPARGAAVPGTDSGRGSAAPPVVLRAAAPPLPRAGRAGGAALRAPRPRLPRAGPAGAGPPAAGCRSRLAERSSLRRLLRAHRRPSSPWRARGPPAWTRPGPGLGGNSWCPEITHGGDPDMARAIEVPCASGPAEAGWPG
jgi:hypothetical protein